MTTKTSYLCLSCNRGIKVSMSSIDMYCDLTYPNERSKSDEPGKSTSAYKCLYEKMTHHLACAIS